MKHNHYIITFTSNKTVFVSAFNEKEALILAQARMIKNGLTYELKSIEQTQELSTITDYEA